MLLLNDPGQRTLELDLETSRGALLQLAFGYRSVAGVLSGENTSARGQNLPESTVQRLLDILLPQGHPFMWEPDRF